MHFPKLLCSPVRSSVPSPPMAIHVFVVSRVTPAHDSDTVLNSANSFTIPLTFFDIPWLLFHPVKRVFFYKITESTRQHFHSFIVPKLKLSLSHVLRDYLPLCGRITWDQNEPKPSIVVSQNDAVFVTIAETDSDFSLLSSYGQRPASELHTLIPELPVSEYSATVLSLQITLFPEQGFSIAVAAHHGVLDGKTSTMFIKAWAHLCKQHLEENNVSVSLPETLTPFLDRSLIKDPTGRLDDEMVKIVRSLKQDASRSLSPLPAWESRPEGVFATLVLSRGDVERLRERVKNESDPSQDQLHLSTFVIAYAYLWTCLVKARGGDMERPVSFLFVADFRERLDPPLPATYFGNCVFPAGSYNNKKAEEFSGEGGFVAAVEILSGLVKGLSSRKIETIAEEFKITFDCVGVTSQFGTLAGSTRLGVYESDFGWGRPVKVDVVSIDGNKISMAERHDESGGIELGLCMKKADLDIVLTLFNNGLQN